MTQSINDIRYHDFVLGTLADNQGRQLRITSRLFDPPVARDFWLVTYAISDNPDHERKFSLLIPVRIAASMASAIEIMKGGALTRIREFSTQHTSSLSAVGPYFSPEGWVLT